jgi:RecA-family ATPase
VAGAPKSFKSTVLLDMAMSVASGEAFAGQLPSQTGTVLWIQEENDPLYLAEAMRHMAVSKGLGMRVYETAQGEMLITPSRDLPMHFIHSPRFDITKRKHQVVVDQLVEMYKPTLLVLDPLYLMLGTADENDNSALRPALAWLTHLRFRYKCSVAVVHHLKKEQEGFTPARMGSLVRGAGSLHSWIEAAWYVSRPSDTSMRLKIGKEFRAQETPPEQNIHLVIAKHLGVHELVYTDGLERMAYKLLSRGATPEQVAEIMKKHARPQEITAWLSPGTE